MKALNVYRDSGVIDVSYINSFEKKVGYEFPTKYKELLSRHNALRPEEQMFDFKMNDHTDSRDVNFFGFGGLVDSDEHIEEYQQELDYCHNHIIVIGESANGDFICFDYRKKLKTNCPLVVLMLHDYLDENNKMLICPVADDFEQFVELLYKDENS
tara:strand:+ start:810 stop:1277 length:468 start_codon:yes stop_codon:yes gene_type:complete